MLQRPVASSDARWPCVDPDAELQRCKFGRLAQDGSNVSSYHVSADLKVVEICAGAGGQSLGLEQAGFEHVAAVEIDPDACRTLRANRPHWDVLEGDVTDPAVFDPTVYEGVTLLAGGVPCPPFSIAGKQLGATDERDLFAFGVGLLGRIRSDAMLLENVRGLASPRFDGYRTRVLDLLNKWGYWAEWRLVQASDFGVPQLRPRFLLVALREEFAPYFSWPEGNPGATPTVGDTLYDLMAEAGWPGAETWREAAAGIAPTIVGGSKKHGGPDLGPTRAKREWRKLHVDAMGIADAPPGPDVSVDRYPRLTNEMVMRIQGWKPADGWMFTGRKTAQYRQIGNAFPPPVARAIGESVRRALLKEGTACGEQQLSLISAMADTTVYRVLASREHDQVSLSELVHQTGQSEEQVRRAIAHLEVDFVIESGERGGESFYRLVDFKGFTGEDVTTVAADEVRRAS